MIDTQSSITINRQRDRVYEVAASYPNFVSFFNYKNIIFSDREVTRVEVGMKKFMINFRWAGEGLKVPQKSIRFVQTRGLLKGLKADWIFYENDAGTTTVKILTYFEIKNTCFNGAFEFLAKNILVEPTTNKILKELKRESEQ